MITTGIHRMHPIIVGIDGQDCVGPKQPWDRQLVGDIAEGPRGFKVELLVRLFHLLDLVFLNTQKMDPWAPTRATTT